MSDPTRPPPARGSVRDHRDRAAANAAEDDAGTDARDRTTPVPDPIPRTARLIVHHLGYEGPAAPWDEAVAWVERVLRELTEGLA